MSSRMKRTLKDITHENKRLKNDSAIDLNFDLGESNHRKCPPSSSTSFESGMDDDDESIFDCPNDDDDNDDDVFATPHVRTSSSTINENRSRRRLNGTSSYYVKEGKDDRKIQGVKKENLLIDRTLNQLREEQARIDAHALSINAQSVKP